ncbi:unnamed protein product [Acanthoscelides obtectus]|uniref:HTH CENPB-type domain-containing protein n=1 Tax=Acanthoscelides obtectus TaxID=200917 RepID=A0A9P0MBU8_ACAOB|nr:unnamed protein product [Acanthoscelides obtectus]CAK1688218.1 hypothetical protein AOBTE_LOCUS36617 [Acanthoscelides obtectus]
MAGWTWLNGFRHRNPTISLRSPESTSAARARALNKVQIDQYFQMLSGVLDHHKFLPNDYWNMDETGITTVPSKNTKVLATKGYRPFAV